MPENESPTRPGGAFRCPGGRVFRLPLATNRERQLARAKHRSQLVFITREARGRAPRVLTAPLWTRSLASYDKSKKDFFWPNYRIPHVSQLCIECYKPPPCQSSKSSNNSGRSATAWTQPSKL